MNIALVHRRFTEHGGTERFLVGLARYLRERGHEIHVYCNEVRPDLADEPGLTFHHLPMIKLGMTAKIASLYYTSNSASRGGHDVVMGFGRTRGHDVFRCGGGAHAAYLEACRPSWRRDLTAWMERAFDREAVMSARMVISPSQHAADDLTRCYGLPPERVRVLHNGVDTDRFRPDPQRRAAAREALGLGEGPALAFFGTGFERKGLADAAAVAETLSLPLFAIGHDAGLARWQRRFPSVNFLGGVSDPERWLPAADAVLLPTRYEPYGNACLEAMACGVPAVTTPVNGVSEVFPVDWLTGTTVAELTEATRRALDAGQLLRDQCRMAAENLPRGRAYEGIEETLTQARTATGTEEST